MAAKRKADLVMENKPFCSQGRDRCLKLDLSSNRTSTRCSTLITGLRGPRGQQATQRPPYVLQLLSVKKHGTGSIQYAVLHSKWLEPILAAFQSQTCDLMPSHCLQVFLLHIGTFPLIFDHPGPIQITTGYHMESQCSNHHSPIPTRPAMPFLAWMKWLHVEGEQRTGSVASGNSRQGLMQELLWQMEQRECPALERELQNCFSSGALGHRRPCTRPGLFALLPSSERRELERLCARIPASHTNTVLSRFREILAHSDVLPWKLVCVFKQVLKDFLRRQEEAGPRRLSPPQPPDLLPVSFPPAGNNTRKPQSCTTPSSPDLQEGQREEIPTISSYVDRLVGGPCPCAVQRDCLPCSFSFPYDCPDSYSTTL